MTLMKCVSCTNSNGFIERDGKIYECMCSALRRIGAAMPPYIRRAKVRPEHIQLPLVKNHKKHYYIFSSWSDMKAVIKLLMIAHSTKLIKVTSDREIRDVYVGSKSRKMVAENSESEVINTLEELVEFPYLVIIRTNELSYKNKAASGAFEEAISIRLDRDKPLWIINHREKPFGKGSIAWSESVNETLHTEFEYLEIPPINSDIDEDFAPSDAVKANLVNPSNLNRTKRKERVIEPVYIDEESVDTPEIEEPDLKPNSLVIDTSSINDDEEENPLAQYGSGLGKNRFRRR